MINKDMVLQDYQLAFTISSVQLIFCHAASLK